MRKATYIITLLKRRRVFARRTFLAGATVLNLLFILIIGTRSISFPNTKIGSLNVGLLTKQQLKNRLQKAYTEPVSLTIQSQTYDESYERLGIYIDTETITRDVFRPNTLPLVLRFVALAKSLVIERTLDSPLLFSQEFFAYTDRISSIGNTEPKIVYVNQQSKTISYVALQSGYIVQTEALQEMLTTQFGEHPISINIPLAKTPNPVEEIVLAANTKLSQSYAEPLTIVILINGAQRFITLSPEDLKKYSLTHIAPDTGVVTFTVDEASFFHDLKKALSVYGDSYPENIVTRIRDEVILALRTRYEGWELGSITIHTDIGPNTDGSKANKYVEVDISQQKLFTFRDGMLLKTYRVSTGKDYPTPTGEFAIQNKTGLGYSKIYDVWMAYWMGFSYSNELNASFGIHELPFYYTGDEKIQRPREFIGAPNTGGCVALDIGDAKEVYQFADIGTPVVIYE